MHFEIFPLYFYKKIENYKNIVKKYIFLINFKKIQICQTIKLFFTIIITFIKKWKRT